MTLCEFREHRVRFQPPPDTGSPFARELVTAVWKPRFFWVSNGSAMQLLCHLMTLCDYPLEFNWCVLVKLPRLFFVSDSAMRKTRVSTLSAVLIPCALAFTSELLSHEETEVLGSYGSANATAVSSHDSLPVPNGDYALEFNWCVMCGVNFYTNF